MFPAIHRQNDLDAGSSNGKTAAFGAVYRGSNPCPAEILDPRSRFRISLPPVDERIDKMADNVVLKADRRTQVGKQAGIHLRLKGRLPAVVYGEKQDPIVCSVDRKELEVILHDQGRNALVSLDLPDGQSQDTTIIKEIQHISFGFPFYKCHFMSPFIYLRII